MKKSFVGAVMLVVSSCSAAASSTDDPLVPIVKTEPAPYDSSTLYRKNIEQSLQNDEVIAKYIRDVEAGFGPIDDNAMRDELALKAFTWCSRLEEGKTRSDFEKALLKISTTEWDVVFNRAVAVAAAINFCPDQLFKFEE